MTVQLNILIYFVAFVFFVDKSPLLGLKLATSKTGFFQNFSAVQHITTLIGITEQIGNLLNLFINICLAFAMDHRKQVICPFGQVPWPVITMADKLQLPDFLAQFINDFVGDIPHGHAVKTITQFVVIGYCADATNNALLLHGCHPRHDYFSR